MTQHRQETNQRPPNIPQEQWRNNIGGPAFPQFVLSNGGAYIEGGMTLRDYFAVKSLPFCYQFWMNDYYHPDCSDAEMRAEEDRDDFDSVMKDLIAEDAYDMADAMLKARQA
jgi:hypothetical protein